MAYVKSHQVSVSREPVAKATPENRSRLKDTHLHHHGTAPGHGRCGQEAKSSKTSFSASSGFKNAAYSAEFVFKSMHTCSSSALPSSERSHVVRLTLAALVSDSLHQVSPAVK